MDLLKKKKQIMMLKSMRLELEYLVLLDSEQTFICIQDIFKTY